jgi:LysM repeat protein
VKNKVFIKKSFKIHMGFLLSEELHRINYLFEHKRGVVISEQSAPGGLKGNYDDSKKEYTVAKGDTLGKIGKAFGVAWKDIFEKNKSTLKSKNANLIYVGEKLIIPIKEEPKVDEPITSEPEKPKVDEPITSETEPEETKEQPKRYKLPKINTDELLSKAPEQVRTKIKEILDSNPYAFLTVTGSYDREFPEVESEYKAKQFAFKITGEDTAITRLYLVATQNDKTKKYKIYRVDELPKSVIELDGGTSQAPGIAKPKDYQPKPVENKPQAEKPKPTVEPAKTETQTEQPKLTTQPVVEAKKQALDILDQLLSGLAPNWKKTGDKEIGFLEAVKKQKYSNWKSSYDELNSTKDNELCSDENKEKVKTKLKGAEEQMETYGGLLTKKEKELCQQLINGLKNYEQLCQTT